MHSAPNGGTTRGTSRRKTAAPFGYQLTFFRRGIPPDQVKTLPSKWSITQLYLAHFAVSDLKKGRFQYAEKLSRAALGKAGAEAERLHVWIDRWRTETLGPEPSGREASAQILEAADGDLAIALTVVPDKPLVVHGTGGISRKGTENGQSSHYYSWTNLATRGSLTIGGESFDVAGTSWMDHEFGSADLVRSSSDGIGSVSRWPIRRKLCSIACGVPTGQPIPSRAAPSSTGRAERILCPSRISRWSRSVFGPVRSVRVVIRSDGA